MGLVGVTYFTYQAGGAYKRGLTKKRVSLSQIWFSREVFQRYFNFKTGERIILHRPGIKRCVVISKSAAATDQIIIACVT